MTQDSGEGLNPVWVANTKLRRRKYDECIAICTTILEKNPYDQAVWYLKARALTLKNWIDDTEIEEEGVAEVLLDENATAQMPRPGTSLARPNTQSQAGQPNQGVRPVTQGGRPVTGFARPGTGSRPTTGSQQTVEGAFKGGRPGTTRPVTSSGRFVRLGTASMLAEPGGPFINVDKLDLRKYAARPALARVLCDYMFYHDHNPKKAVELASLATVAADFQDWWWKERLGKGYYQLGLFRDAEKQFKSSQKNVNMIATVLQLAKIYIRLDQPSAAVQTYVKGAEAFPGETSMLLGQARICDALNEMAEGVVLYKKTLFWDAANVEAIACLASHHFYSDQPEIALRFYRRLLQMGVNNTELWNNLGLCCFYASQYDMTLSCFERALALADDENMVAIGIGDLGLAYQSFKISVSVDSNHAESFNNLGVLELRKGNAESAKSNFMTSAEMAEHTFEPFYNNALLSFKTGDFQESFEQAGKALESYPDHSDSQELRKQLQQHFTLL